MRLLLYVILLVLACLITALTGCDVKLEPSSYGEAVGDVVAMGNIPLTEDMKESIASVDAAVEPHMYTEQAVYPVGTTEIKLILEMPVADVEPAPDLEYKLWHQQGAQFDYYKTLEVYQNGQWYQIPPPPMESTPEILLSIGRGEQYSFTIDLTAYEYTFAPGRYRILKDVLPTDYLMDSIDVTLAAEFSIE